MEIKKKHIQYDSTLSWMSVSVHAVTYDDTDHHTMDILKYYEKGRSRNTCVQH